MDKQLNTISQDLNTWYLTPVDAEDQDEYEWRTRAMRLTPEMRDSQSEGHRECT